MSRRSDLFRRAGVPALPEYVRRTGDRLAAIVLILDEVASSAGGGADGSGGSGWHILLVVMPR